MCKQLDFEVWERLWKNEKYLNKNLYFANNKNIDFCEMKWYNICEVKFNYEINNNLKLIGKIDDSIINKNINRWKVELELILYKIEE